MPFSGILLKIYHTYAKNTSASRFLFCKIHSNPHSAKKALCRFVSAAESFSLLYASIMLISCRSLRYRSGSDDSDLYFPDWLPELLLYPDWSVR
jgi:hypothetical protein